MRDLWQVRLFEHVARFAIATCLILIAAGLFGFGLVQTLRGREVVAIQQPLLVAQTALNTSSVLPAGRFRECREATVYVGWSTGTTSGAVAIETAVDETYVGTWAPLATVTYTAGAPKQEIVQLTGTLWGFRTRISTVLAGGNVSTWLVCN